MSNGIWASVHVGCIFAEGLIWSLGCLFPSFFLDFGKFFYQLIISIFMYGSGPFMLPGYFVISSRVWIYVLINIITALHNCSPSGSLNSQNLLDW